MTNDSSIKKPLAKGRSTVNSKLFTDEYIEKLKKLPPLPRETENKMRVFVNLLIDRILDDHKKGKI